MMPYAVTLAAQSDIADIVSTIGQENPRAADRPVLFWPVKQTSYATIYRIGSPVEIVRVVHWRRDIPALLSDEM